MLTLLSKDSALFEKVRYEDIMGYLRATGWAQQTTNNRYWHVFTQQLPETSAHLEIVLPSTKDVPDLPMHIMGAINALAALHNTAIEDTVQQIAWYEKDVWLIRNRATDDAYALSLSHSLMYLHNITAIVKTAGSSEDKALPYFTTYLHSGEKMADYFHMEPTFLSRYGLTIESRINDHGFCGDKQPKQSINNDYVPNNHENSENGVSLAPSLSYPLERRVMERIARGLMVTQKAIETGDIAPLVEHYTSGFAANACQALAEISMIPLEHYIQWSPKIVPAEDVRAFVPVRLDYTSAHLLTKAAETLRLVEPHHQPYKGTHSSTFY